MKPKLELNLIATTYGGPERYHPAMRDRDYNIWYWPNVTLETEAEAYQWAEHEVNSLGINYIVNAQKDLDSWNIFQV